MAEYAKALITKKTLFIGISLRRYCMNAGKKRDALIEKKGCNYSSQVKLLFSC